MRRRSFMAASTISACVAATLGFTPAGIGAAAATPSWQAQDAVLSPLSGSGPNGTAGISISIAGAQPSVSATLDAPVAANGVTGIKGWLRQTAGTPAVVHATVTDAAGDTAVSAPLHLAAWWQSFGVTLHVAPAAQGQAVHVTLAPAGTGTLGVGAHLDLAGISAASAPPSVTKRVAGTREITLNGAVFNPRGWLYWATPIGDTGLYSTVNDPATCQADAQLLGADGATIVQIPFDNEVQNAAPSLTQCLDAFWAAGVGIAVLLDPPFAVYSATDAGTIAWEANVRLAAQLYASHPATELWLMGNEIDLNGGSDAPGCFFDIGTCAVGSGHQFDTLAALLKSLDPNHLVGTKICCNYAVQTSSDVPQLDFWGVDAYPATSFGTNFTFWKNNDPSRPTMITEFGNDRFFCASPTVNLNSTTVAICAANGSGEDQPDQNTANSGLWREIISNEATASNPQGSVIGGTTFMYSDLWWFDGFDVCGGPNTHDSCATSGGVNSYPDNWWAPEWIGATDAQLPQQAGDPRVTTQSFTALGQIWTGLTYPTVSGATVSNVTSCRATVSWTTAEAATSRADYGVVQMVAANGQLQSDNTTFPSNVQDATFATSHQLTLTGLAPGTTYRVVARGFDSAGRTANALPLQFTTALTSPSGCP